MRQEARLRKVRAQVKTILTAEDVGFEPTVALATLVFKTNALGR